MAQTPININPEEDYMINLPSPNQTPTYVGLSSDQFDFTIPISASTSQVNSNTLSSDGFELQDQTIIPNEIISSSFTPGENYVEFYIYSAEKSLLSSTLYFENWTITNNSNREQLSGSYIDITTELNVIEKASTTVPTGEITLNPSSNIYSEGFENGTLYASYNFVNYELGSTPNLPFYLSKISSDRTEIAIKSNLIPQSKLTEGYVGLVNAINNNEFFDEFYVSFYNNNYVIAINLQLSSSISTSQTSSLTSIVSPEDPISNDTIFIKLYEPLPQQYQLKDELYIASKVGESQAYKVEFLEDFSELIEQANFIQGPNINIPLKDLINNSTGLKSYEDLMTTPSSESLNNLLNILNKKGVTITPNYSYNTFNEFINFSSAKARINNFIEKVSQIQSYEADISIIVGVTGSNPNVKGISSSLASLQTNITNLVTNFDGYESYLYNNSSSFSYPKTGSSYPYALLPTSSVEVLIWLGSDVENAQYYGGYVLSASLYDENNQNWLYYTIPNFIKENSNNNEYIEFSNMVGQSFDEVWLYTRALSERYNTSNSPDRGLPLGLAAEAVKGLGFETFGNNYDNQDNFIGLTGEDNGSYIPPTGSELITQYIAVNSGSIVNYWSDGYSWVDYVQSITEPGFPYAIDKVSKEIFKRLYHNMAYLTKKKGTISGLRQLINIWGIPNTILRINEFGGKNRDNSNDYDLWYNRFSYAYTPTANSYAASSSVKVPWMPLERNYIAEDKIIVPDGLAFRFKTTGFPSSSFGGSYFSQSLAVKKSNGTYDNDMDWGIQLSYENKPSGSYSGSSNSDYYEYGKMKFVMSASIEEGGTIVSDDIYLPFFNKGWWSVLLQRNQHPSSSDNSIGTIYTLQVANNQYNGVDGNIIGWTGSVSIDTSGTQGYGTGNYGQVIYDPTGPNFGYGVGTYGLYLYGSLNVTQSANAAWNRFGVTEFDGVYVGGYISGSNIATEYLSENGKIFSGSLQEFRYYSNNIPTEVFHDFTMNPESIEGNSITGSESSFDIVNFRAPLGNELEYVFTASQYGGYVENILSTHPAITGSSDLFITGSFRNPSNSTITSSYEFIHYSSSVLRTYSKPNTEVYQMDQPSVGIRNRISNKIQVEDGNTYGNILSTQISIDQNYLISQSYTKDIVNLEVAFSPQDEVNDDIINTFGYGVISDTLADPRFAFDSKLNYYPKLRSVAIDYFKKYTEGNVYDYLRLIKYFDNSLFKAIKSYVPARTSVTTGVIIKQNLLERNRRPSVTISPNTTVALTVETGSLDNIPTSETGLNSAIQLINLELTGSIYGNNGVSDIVSIKGGTGGSVKQYNGIQTYPSQSTGTLNLENLIPLITLNTLSGITNNTNTISFSTSDGGILTVQLQVNSGATNNIQALEVTDIQPSNYSGFTIGEKFTIFGLLVGQGGGSLEFTLTEASLSNLTPTTPISNINGFGVTQSWAGINETISGSVPFLDFSQTEFYDGEYSGSILVVTTQSLLNNPYSTFTGIDSSYYTLITQSAFVTTGSAVEGGGTPPANLTVNLAVFGSENYNTAKNALDNFAGTPSNGAISLFLPPSQFIPGNPGDPPVTILPYQQIAAIYLPNNYGTVSDYSDISSIFTAASTNQRFPYNENKRLTTPAADYSFYNLAPYFTFQLGNVLRSGTTITLTYPSDSNTPGLNMGKVISPLLAGNSGMEYIKKSGGLLMKRGGNNSGVLGDNRNLGLPSGSVQHGDSFNNVVITLGNYNSSRDDFENTFRIGTTSNLLSPGTASLQLYEITYTGSTGDSGEFYPTGYAFNKKSINDDGELIDNSNTIANNPNWNVSLNFTGTSQTSDSYNVFGSDFYQQYNPGVVGPNFDIINGTNSYWLYEGINNRPLTGSSTFLPTLTPSLYYNFDPLLPSITNFYQSAYYPLINNISGSELNTYVEQLDFTNGIETPVNLQEVINKTAAKAEVNDSFYTTIANILPRYLGSKLSSADYNNYTPPTSNITYLNTLSGSNNSQSSWPGDTSYGNQSVISHYPIYFAHFRSSYNNLNLENTYTFEIDSLIISPQNDITGENAPITPITIKVDGSGNNLYEIKSTFERDRKVAISYDSVTYNNINYGNLEVGDNKIFQGALEMNTVGATTSGKTGPFNLNRFPNFTTTMSFQTASWTGGWDGNVKASASSDAGSDKNYLITGSSCFYLGGEIISISQNLGLYGESDPQDNYFDVKIKGPGLGVVNSQNIAVSRSLAGKMIEVSGSEKFSGGIPIALSASFTQNPTLINDNANYIIQDFISSNLGGYKEAEGGLPFIIKKGDEIVVSYNNQIFETSGSSNSINNYETQTFIVTGTTSSFTSEGGGDMSNLYSQSYCISPSDICYDFQGIPSPADEYGRFVNDWLQNQVNVYPNPQNSGIINGQISQFILRRRINSDDRVIIYQSPPSTFGISETTGSGGGYLIPGDFSPQQKRNTLTLINQLKQKNAFKDDLNT